MKVSEDDGILRLMKRRASAMGMPLCSILPFVAGEDEGDQVQPPAAPSKETVCVRSKHGKKEKK